MTSGNTFFDLYLYGTFRFEGDKAGMVNISASFHIVVSMEFD